MTLPKTGLSLPGNSLALEQQVVGFLRGYLEVENEPVQATLQHYGSNYGDRVFHYGRFKSRQELTAEYERFVARWPLRKHTLRPDSVTANCQSDGNSCEIGAIIDWEVASLTRNAKSAGVSTWHLVFAHQNGSFLITSIDGKVIDRHMSQLNPERGPCLGKLCLFDQRPAAAE